jgi:hypothetical protein
MLERVMRSGCVSCVPRVFLHASVVYVACGIEIVDVEEHQDSCGYACTRVYLLT